MVIDPTERQKQKNFIAIAMVTFLGIGLFRVITSLMREHYNLLFLAIMMVIGLVVIAALAVSRRLSYRGLQYLKDIQSAHSYAKILP